MRVFEYWLLAALVFGFIIVGIAYMLARLSNNPSRFMRNVLLVALTPTVLFVAIIELVVTPMWGTEAALRLAPFSYFVWLVSATLLIKEKW